LVDIINDMDSLQYIQSNHTPEEKKASLDLVRESYGEHVDIAYEKYYDWQYLENPFGKGNIILAYEGGQAIAQLASVPCMYKIQSSSVPVSLIMNLCVSPRYQQKGMSVQLMSGLINRIQRINEPSILAVVMPNNTAIKVFVRHKFYSMPMKLLIRPTKLSKLFHNPAPRMLLRPFDYIWKKGKSTCVQEYPTIFDTRFDDFDIEIGLENDIRHVRDSKFLNWRYKNNPRRKYKVFTQMGKDGKLNGYIVVRITEALRTCTGFIMDFVVRRGNIDCGRDLVQCALEYFWSNDTTLAVVACISKSVEYSLLKKAGFLTCPDRFRPHPLTICVKNLKEEQMKGRDNKLLDPSMWFFMFGDYETF
jgi:hypothetical protein